MTPEERRKRENNASGKMVKHFYYISLGRTFAQRLDYAWLSLWWMQRTPHEKQDHGRDLCGLRTQLQERPASPSEERATNHSSSSTSPIIVTYRLTIAASKLSYTPCSLENHCQHWSETVCEDCAAKQSSIFTAQAWHGDWHGSNQKYPGFDRLVHKHWVD